MHRNPNLRSIGSRTWLLAICLLTATIGRAAAADDTPLAESPPSEPTTIAPALTVGDAYTLAVTRGEAKQTFGGNLVKATEHWLVLRRISTGKSENNVPLLSQMPMFGSAFRRSQSGMIEEDLWIPRDAAQIESHIRVANGAKPKPVKGTQPPTRNRCAMMLNESGEAVRRDGNLASIGAKGVVLMVPGGFFSQQRRKVPHEDILCISVSNYISDIRVTHRSEQE
jgi:hypothetical protein